MPSESVHRFVKAPDIVAGRKCYLLIDGVRAIDQMQFKVNGKLISERPVPLVSKYPGRAAYFSFADQCVALMKRSSADLRAWWVLPLPDGLPQARPG